VLGGEQVAWVRLTVQELLSDAMVADHSPQASQRVAKKPLHHVGADSCAWAVVCASIAM
jgi:hypothetical protein